MNKVIVSSILCLLFTFAFSQENLVTTDLLIHSEDNPESVIKAKRLAMQQKLPISIFKQGELWIEAIGVKNNIVLYSVCKDMLHPDKSSYIASYQEVVNTYSLENAAFNFGNINTNSPPVEIKTKVKKGTPLYLIPESTNDRVMAFDVNSGDLVDMDFILPTDSLSTPIEAVLSPRTTITISDQISDVVMEFDTSGTCLGTFAPVGGANTAILDNMRGHVYLDNGNLLVTVAGGTNQDAIAEFDSTGNYIGNFIAPNAANMDGPWDILFRNSDILVSASSSHGIHRYDLAGSYLDDFASGISFPEQITELGTGEVAVAHFSTPSGIMIFPSSGGSYTSLLTGVTGNRGVAELGNGNLLTTNGTGVHEIDINSGSLVRTIVSGVSARFITLYELKQGYPAFAAKPDTIDFGIVIEDSIYYDSVLVKNTGNDQLDITSIFSDNPAFSVVDDTIYIAPGDSMFYNISFIAGLDSGLQNGNIIFTHNGDSSPDTIYAVASVITALEQNTLQLANSFKLHQNFPNPFNPSTRIKFNLPKLDKVKIEILNVLGQKLDTILDEIMISGLHELEFNGSNLPSGVYYYRIQAGEYHQVKKMLLLR